MTSNPGQFGIGTYQPINSGTTYGSGWQSIGQSLVLAPPLSGVYGGTYGFVVDTTIRAPTQVQYNPAPEIGQDSIGASVVRGFPALIWTYTRLRPDYWYYLINLYRQSARTPPGFQYLVLLQYLDPQGSGQLLQQMARWDPPTYSGRMQPDYESITLKFSYLGQAQLQAGTPIIIKS